MNERLRQLRCVEGASMEAAARAMGLSVNIVRGQVERLNLQKPPGTRPKQLSGETRAKGRSTVRAKLDGFIFAPKTLAQIAVWHAEGCSITGISIRLGVARRSLTERWDRVIAAIATLKPEQAEAAAAPPANADSTADRRDDAIRRLYCERGLAVATIADMVRASERVVVQRVHALGLTKPGHRSARPPQQGDPDVAQRRCLGRCGQMRLSLHKGDRVCRPCKEREDWNTALDHGSSRTRRNGVVHV